MMLKFWKSPGAKKAAAHKPVWPKKIVTRLEGREYVIPMNPSDETIRRALTRIAQAAADSKQSVHQRMALADDVLRIIAEELSDNA